MSKEQKEPTEKGYEDILKEICRPLSTKPRYRKGRSFTYAGRVECDNMITPKIQQNAAERTASMAAARSNVGGII